MQTYASDILPHANVRSPVARARHLLAALLLAAVGCSANTQLAPSTGYSMQLGAKHPLVGHVYAGKTREPVASSALLQTLEHARYIVLGETHDNPDHHQLQAQLLQHFLAAQPGAAVAFEMLDEDDASPLAREPVSQSASELAKRVAWASSGWPDFALYKTLFEVALTAHARIVAAHPSTEHVRASMRGVDDTEAHDLHLDVPLPNEQVQAQHDEIRESHCGHANTQMLTAMQRAQVYKDAYMARALTRTSVPTALIAGRGHARNDRAVPYFLQRSQAAAVSVAFIEVNDSAIDPGAYDTTAFDYVVFTPRVSDADPCEEFRKQLEKMHTGDGTR